MQMFARGILHETAINIIFLSFSLHPVSWLVAIQCPATLVYTAVEEDIVLFFSGKKPHKFVLYQMKMSLFFFDSLISQADFSGHFHGSGSSLLLCAVRDGRENKCSKCLWLH